MKIPGLFGKTPKHQRFAYKPRYYDPKEEELKGREERIRQELARENGTLPGEVNEDEILGHRSRMKGSFQSARKRSTPKSKDEPNYAIIRLGILLLLTLLIVGFFEWGGTIFYSLFLVFPIWIYFKFIKKNKEG